MSFGLFLALICGCCGYALWRGGPPERIVAGLLLGAFALGLPMHTVSQAAGYRTALIGTLAIDVVLLVALGTVAHRSTRYWPFLLAAWQLVVVLAHLGKWLNPAMLPLGYAFQTVFWSYPMVALTGVGAWRHRVRVAAGVADPAWQEMRR